MRIQNNNKASITKISETQCSLFPKRAFCTHGIRNDSMSFSASFSSIRQIKARYTNTIMQFPADRAYYIKLANSLGLNNKEYKLASIVGKEQLSKLLNKFNDVDFMVKDNMEGIKDLSYRVNLHNHTLASDGKMSVGELLDQARKWADKIALSKKDDKPPFTIAITDHDTTEGAKEAIKIISSDPLKFKNLRVVLGSEISVSYFDPKDVIRPVDFELISYALNPYDKGLNTVLSEVSQNRQKSIKAYIDEAKTKYPKYDLSLEEAKGFHANIKNVKTNGILYLTRDYLQHKIFFTKYVEKINNDIIPKNQEKLDATKIFKSLADNYYYEKDIGNQIDQKSYYESILKKILKKRGLELCDIKVENSEKLIEQMFKKYMPTMEDTKGIIISSDKIFDATHDGFFGMAHPALIKLHSDMADNITPSRSLRLNGKEANRNLVLTVFADLVKKGGGVIQGS